MVDDSRGSAPVGQVSMGHASTSHAPIEHAHVEEAYARWAPIYDRAFTAVMRPGRRAAAAALAALVRPDAPLRVLDVGVGTGLELPMFPREARIVGVDLSEPMLSLARARVAREGLSNVEALIAMDAMNLSFEDASFDAVVSPYVVTTVPDPARTLDEMARVTRPGGEIVLVNHVGAQSGPIAWAEGFMARHSHRLGWRPDFPWEIIGGWARGRSDVTLLERRRLAPLGLFTIARFRKSQG
jgi:phosphatidylethanolamine/phosphatidyl-N-methylethanolamine N-methyltransferase